MTNIPQHFLSRVVRKSGSLVLESSIYIISFLCVHLYMLSFWFISKSATMAFEFNIHLGFRFFFLFPISYVLGSYVLSDHPTCFFLHYDRGSHFYKVWNIYSLFGTVFVYDILSHQIAVLPFLT